MGKESLQNMDTFLATDSLVKSTRIIYTPSAFARSSLIHLQETGTLQAMHPHKSERNDLTSYLFFTVLSGSGRLLYDGNQYELHTGDCVFIDCRKSYRHETGKQRNAIADADLWCLCWCHFYGPNMNAVYRKYQERGGCPVFQTQQVDRYQSLLAELYQLADSADYVRDMRINEKLSSLLTLLMEDAWRGEKITNETSHTVDIQQVKEYIDLNYTEKITLDDLAARFFINKFYLLALFKERYGITINAYVNQVRVTYVKQQLRFTDKTIECLAAELHIESTYLSRLFKKVEGVSPREFRKIWKGK